MILDKKQMLEFVRDSPVAFGIEGGFDKLADIHNKWIRLFLYSRKDTTLQAHRGSYKTTCLSVAIALLIVTKPRLNAIFIRKSDDDVKEIVGQIAKLLKTSLFHALSTVLWGKPCILTKETAFEIDTNLKQGPRGTSQLIGMGTMSSITGKHADIIITDDIVNIDDRISKAHRERTKLTYQELQNIRNPGGRIINAGTPWHKDDCFTLMPNIIKYDCYSTGMMTDADIQAKRNSMTTSLFAANYELKHIADENVLFTAPTIDDGSNTEKIYNGVAHIDAAYGGEDGSAFSIIKRHTDGKIYVYGELKQNHIDDVLEGFEEKRKFYRAGTMYTEFNADKGYLNKKIDPPRVNYHEGMNKYIKISTHLKGEWENIIFLKDTCKEYINQILDYNENATHDDAPDSLSSIIRETQYTPRGKNYSGKGARA